MGSTRVSAGHGHAASTGPAAGGEQWSWQPLREAQRTILLDILIHGTRSRADLARRSGLSRATLSRLTRELSDAGFIRETAAPPAEGRGRPSEVFGIVAEAVLFLGFKLTGDSLYTAVVDLGAGVVHSEEQRLATRDVEGVVELLARVGQRMRRRFPRISAAGVCLAGDVSADPRRGAVVVGSAFLGWDEVPLERLLSAQLRLPVTVGNDVQALTTAHHWFGAGVGASSLALIGFGDGIGAGLVLDDRTLTGAKGHPGKVGHLPVDSGPARCDQGHVGCVSAYVTIPAIRHNSGRSELSEVLEAARDGDARAIRALDAAAGALGTVVSGLTNLFDPQRIIITGEGLVIAQRGSELFWSSVRRGLDPASENPTVIFEEFEFTDYAWGAAITAISSLI